MQKTQDQGWDTQADIQLKTHTNLIQFQFRVPPTMKYFIMVN